MNKRDVKDGSDEDLTQEPEMIRAFRDRTRHWPAPRIWGEIWRYEPPFSSAQRVVDVEVIGACGGYRKQ